MGSYSICEKHYNQIIATNQFYQYLTLIGSAQDNKRFRFSTDEDNVTIPVDQPDVVAKLDRVRRLLKYNQLENQQSQLITDLTNRLTQMQRQLENQRDEIEDLKGQLQIMRLRFVVCMKHSAKQMKCLPNSGIYDIVISTSSS